MSRLYSTRHHPSLCTSWSPSSPCRPARPPRAHHLHFSFSSSCPPVGEWSPWRVNLSTNPAHSSTIFPCYLGLEINSKTRWTIITKIELANQIQKKQSSIRLEYLEFCSDHRLPKEHPGSHGDCSCSCKKCRVLVHLRELEWCWIVEKAGFLSCCQLFVKLQLFSPPQDKLKAGHSWCWSPLQIHHPRSED